MLDIKFIRENKRVVVEVSKNKNIKIDLDELLEIDEKRRSLMTELDQIRAERNELAKSAKDQRLTDEQIEAGKKLKTRALEIKEKLKSIENKY